MSVSPSATSAQARDRKVPAAKIQFLPEDRAWIAARIEEVLGTGQLTLGKYGAQFEENFARFSGTEYAIAVNSGTSSLEIILRALGVAGKEVLVPTNTFFATAAAVVHAGGRPVLVDMDPESFGLRPEDLEDKLTPKTEGLIVVHIGGIVSRRLPELQEWAGKKGLWLVEDAAHAHGSSLNGVRAGAFGIASSFSFYPTKVMTSAEGGMIVTNDAHLAAEARIYRDQGKASFTQNAHVRMGYNWRLSEPHAIIGLKHLERLPAMIAERQGIAALYDAELRHLRGLKTVPVPAGGQCNYYKYLVLLNERRDRKALKTVLRDQYGVSLAGEVYEEPLHQQPVFASYSSGRLPVAEDYCARHLCLPIFPGMEKIEAEQVIEALKTVIG
ncbi:MAG: DegT/DnrJ/EryC1/StrS aminotransferase [Nitrospira sp.]|jgi:dTDP-4-amino-4,6-dideoxygalactose transaminase|nr:MAG: DegT/DnrJ/EryC1/StrS aminotransferase [Nitrospira sp.]